MEVNSSKDRLLSPQKIVHLEKLKSIYLILILFLGILAEIIPNPSNN